MRPTIARLSGPAATLLAVLILAACGGGSTAPSDGSAGTPQIEGAWVRTPLGPDRPTAGYLTIRGSETDDALISASTPAAGHVEIHETIAGESGMAGMQAIERLEVPAGGTVTLEPGGYHLMIMEPDADALAPGATVELTLVFEEGGQVVVEAQVRED